jgi:polyketide biosynthesis acyl carrier protein
MDRNDVLNLIIRCTREVIPGLDTHAFAPHDRLESLGANSVDRAEIATLAMESLALNFPRIEISGPKTIGELAALLHDKLPRA